MPDGGELMVRTDRTGQSARVQISDTGAGIAKDKLSRVFDPFYSSRPGGSGLGLPTAKRIIESHAGKISVTSEPTKGTLFTIELPLSGKE
jgi:signal transduction histidine kinase